MIEEHLPRIDVHRLKSASRFRGYIQLRGNLTVRYMLNLRDLQLSLGIKGRALYHYILQQPPQHRLEVRCPDCGRWVELLYWSPHAKRHDLELAAVCRRCVGATHLSQHYHRETVPGHRADLRAEYFAPVIQAIQDDYIAVRIAMEKEGIIPDHRRLFTMSSGHRRRWAYRKKK